MESSSVERAEVRIERLAAGGDGVGRLDDGCVVFVPFTAPGETVRVCVTERRKRFARGVVEALIEPGEGRAAPRCAVFGECGGCSWQHLDYATQLRAKQSIVTDALERVGKLAGWPSVEITPSPEPYGYRGRARVRATADAVGFRVRGSHALCAVDACPVLVPPLEKELHALASDDAREEGEYELVATPEGARRTRLPATATDPPRVRIGEDSLRVSPGVFTQSNALLHEALVGQVLALAGEGERALELHAGAGFFSLGLARRFAHLELVESHPIAVRDLRANLAEADFPEVVVHAADVAGTGWPDPPGPLDLVLVDPPRSGVPRDTLERLGGLAPRRMVYVSCDPATLARDLAHQIESGATLVHIEAFDLFPQTPHVEVIAVLERRDRAENG